MHRSEADEIQVNVFFIHKLKIGICFKDSILISRVIGFKVLGLQNCMFVPLTREKAKSVTKMHNASYLLNKFVALAFFCFQYLHVIKFTPWKI